MANWYCASDKYTAVTAWAASTALTAGSIRRQVSPAIGSERCFRTAAGGTTGTTEPVWVLTKGGASPTDGTITDWVEVTGSSLYNSTNSWLAPHARMRLAAAWMAAGDVLYVGNHHAATEAATVTVAFPGTLALPNFAYSVDDTNATPTLLAGGSDQSTGASAVHQINGTVFAEGLTLLSGGGTALYANSQSVRQTFKNCTLGFNANTSGAQLLVGNSGGTRQFFFINPTFKLLQATQRISPNGHLRINGGQFSSDSVTNALISLASGNGGAVDIVIDGFDASIAPVGFNFVVSNGATSGGGQVRVQNCKPPASWTGNLSNGVTTPIRLEMFATAVDDSVFQEQVIDYTGNVVQETATFTRGTNGAVVPNSKSGGVDPQPFAWKFSPSASCSFPANALKSTQVSIDTALSGYKSADLANAPSYVIGNPITLTTQILVDSATEPSDNDIFMDIAFMSTSGFTTNSSVSTAPASTLTPAQTLTSKFGGAGSGWTTTGMTNPKMRKLVATFTPQEKGFLLATINVANSAFTAVYVDPNIVVS